MPDVDDLRVRVTADTSGLIDGLERANEAVLLMGRAFSVGFAQAIKTAAEFEQQINRLDAQEHTLRYLSDDEIVRRVREAMRRHHA